MYHGYAGDRDVLLSVFFLDVVALFTPGGFFSDLPVKRADYKHETIERQALMEYRKKDSINPSRLPSRTDCGLLVSYSVR